MLILGQLQPAGRGLAASPGDPRIAALQQRLSQAEPADTTPADMARWVGLSPSRFRVWFASQFGRSPKRYLIHQRIQQAKRLLRETPQPVKAIADHLRYADLPAFYRDFRAHTGTTPVAYRKRHTVSA